MFLNKSNIIKNIKNSKEINPIETKIQIQKRYINDFLKEKFKNTKEKEIQENLFKYNEIQKGVLEQEIKNVEKLRESFTNLLPKVLDSIKVIENKNNSQKEEVKEKNILKAELINEEESNKNVRSLNQIQNLSTNNYIKTDCNNNQNRRMSLHSSINSKKRKDLKSLSKNYNRKAAYEEKFKNNDIFYHPNKNYFVKNKYKQLFV